MIKKAHIDFKTGSNEDIDLDSLTVQFSNQDEATDFDDEDEDYDGFTRDSGESFSFDDEIYEE